LSIAIEAVEIGMNKAYPGERSGSQIEALRFIKKVI
jgi:hypothetical protein